MRSDDFPPIHLEKGRASRPAIRARLRALSLARRTGLRPAFA
ncbi:hypothetical protein [Sphingomonas sp.]|nr:hypothetical protein [Sphingomonas sp.]